MCIYPSHPQVTCVFISDSLSSSLQSEEVSPILFPHLICLSLSLDTGPYSKIVSHFSASSPLPNQPISSRAPLNQGVSLGGFFLSFSSQFIVELFSHERAPLIFFFVQISWTWAKFFQPLVFWDLALKNWMQFFILSFHLSWMQPNLPGGKKWYYIRFFFPKVRYIMLLIICNKWGYEEM